MSKYGRYSSGSENTLWEVYRALRGIGFPRVLAAWMTVHGADVLIWRDDVETP